MDSYRAMWIAWGFGASNPTDYSIIDTICSISLTNVTSIFDTSISSVYACNRRPPARISVPGKVLPRQDANASYIEANI